MAVDAVKIEADAYMVCLTHALTTEREEVMGLLIGEVCLLPLKKWGLKIIFPEFQKNRLLSQSNVGRFAYRSLQNDSPTLESIRLHVLKCFAYSEVDSPTTKYRRKVN